MKHITCDDWVAHEPNCGKALRYLPAVGTVGRDIVLRWVLAAIFPPPAPPPLAPPSLAARLR